MCRWDLSCFLFAKNTGLIFSAKHRLSLENSFKTICLIAPTSSGKTTRFVIPSIFRCKGSAVITDPSGEIYLRTSGHLADRGYRIQVIQPSKLKNSLRFNPLARLKGIHGQHDAANIYSGSMGNKLLFSDLDLESVTHLEKVLGTSTAYDVVYGEFNEKARTFAKPFSSADEIRMLDMRKGILISGHQRPIKIPPISRLPPSHSAHAKKTLAEIQPNESVEKIKYLHFDSRPVHAPAKRQAELPVAA